MGCSTSGSNLNNSNEQQPDPVLNHHHKDKDRDVCIKKSVKESKMALSFKYTSYPFQTEGLQNSNLLLFTTYFNQRNEFNSMNDKAKDKQEQMKYKSSNQAIAVGYKKGYKLEFVNQDKFFVLMDGTLQVYCVIDGHGPFGNTIAQIVQDYFFLYFTKFNRTHFVEDPEKAFNDLFEGVNLVINNREEKQFGNYDPFLSGAATTVIVRINNTLYCANVGNVIAVLFASDKLCPSKFHITQLLFNDSNFKEETLNAPQRKFERSTTDSFIVNNLINPNLINDEIRRIYEHGGETRRLQGEVKSRIFVKGKYFPGLINTRSLGDQIGNGIGVKPNPHYSKYHLQREINYYLLLCSDGVNNVCSIEKIVNIVQNNDVLLLESISSILQESQSMYRTHLYTPDMTVILKELKADE